MKNPKHMTDAQIHWNIQDINEAISAMPENPKIYTYLSQRELLHKERTRRQEVRIFRRTIKQNAPADILGKPDFSYRRAVKQMNAWKASAYARNSVWSASYMLATLR